MIYYITVAKSWLLTKLFLLFIDLLLKLWQNIYSPQAKLDDYYLEEIQLVAVCIQKRLALSTKGSSSPM